MNIIFMLFVFMSLALPCFAGTSTSFVNSVEVFGGGGGDTASTNYIIHGKTRGTAYDIRNSASFRVGEGFIHSSYYGLTLQPIISSILPDNGNNTVPIAVTILGYNFMPGVVVRLIRYGQPPITGEGTVVSGSGRIDCTFNLNGKIPGSWSLELLNPDGKITLMLNAFTVSLPGGRVEVKGKPINYPNPFDPDKGPTTIKFELSKDAAIDIYLFNIRGTRIWESHFEPGSIGGKLGVNEVLWNGINAFSEDQPNGIYVYQISSGGRTLATGKIAIFR